MLMILFYFGSVFAINSLCAALGYPAIPGWIAIGGDPCDGTWQGIRCDSELIVSMYGKLFCFSLE